MTSPAPTIRPARPSDLRRVVAAADIVFRTPLRPGLGSMGRDYPLLFDPGNAGNLWIAESGDGSVLAHAGFVVQPASVAGQSLAVACFGAVFTVAEQEGRGLASGVFAAATAQARAAGVDLALVSGARGLYERAGFSPYPPCRRYRLPAASDDRRATSTGLRVVPYSRDALAAIRGLHAEEPVRFERSAEDWTRLLAPGVLFFYPGEVFLIERGGRSVAYAAAARLYASEAGPATARILELGGEREAIVAAGPEIARHLGVASLELVLPPSDPDLPGLADSHGWEPGEVRFPFSAAWWNPARAHLPLPFYGLSYV